MHSSTDPRVVRCLDGLSMSFLMLDQIHRELHPTCVSIKTDKRNLARAFWLCWSFVDTVHRIREVAQASPGLSKKAPEVRLFLDATSIAEKFRHYIQHLRSELSKSPGNLFPVWGSLSWVDDEDSQLTYIALAGAQLGNISYSGCVFDTHNRDWVSKVALSVDDLSFNFDLIFEYCVEFRDFVMSVLVSTYSPGITFQEDLPIITMRVIMGDSTEPEQQSADDAKHS